ncbi:MAG: polysaccharide deacetylase family protein [Clostridia bacterium]|nr:hypothetical protein [Oscillospiraceae bacterium]MBQ7960883.1 polysaccharide deacetylase family protein [Clostridia bacterium]
MKRLFAFFLVFIMLFSVTAYGTEKDCVRVPALMYHSVDEGHMTTIISVDNFRKHMEIIRDNGYTPVSLEDLVDYVDYGMPLPEKPVIITFDDGYRDNYTNAFPVLREFGFKATIFAIGSSVGKELYKETVHKIIPHFSYEEAREMIDSKLIAVQSHSYDMHQRADFESSVTPRESVLRLEGESFSDYVRALECDITLSKTLLEAETKKPVIAFAYPRGMYNAVSDYILKKNGIRITMAISTGANYIKKYDKNSLYNLHRYNMHNGVSGEQLLKWLDEE